MAEIKDYTLIHQDFREIREVLSKIYDLVIEEEKEAEQKYKKDPNRASRLNSYYSAKHNVLNYLGELSSILHQDKKELGLLGETSYELKQMDGILNTLEKDLIEISPWEKEFIHDRIRSTLRHITLFEDGEKRLIKDALGIRTRESKIVELYKNLIHSLQNELIRFNSESREAQYSALHRELVETILKAWNKFKDFEHGNMLVRAFAGRLVQQLTQMRDHFKRDAEDRNLLQKDWENILALAKEIRANRDKTTHYFYEE